MTRTEVIQHLAQVSHDTYIRQRMRDKGHTREAIVAEMGEGPTPHDLERAEDAVHWLEQHDLLKPF